MVLASVVAPFALAEEVLVGQGSVAVQVNQVPQAFVAGLTSFQAVQAVDFVVAVFGHLVEASLVVASCLVAGEVQAVSAFGQAEAAQVDRAVVVQEDQAGVVQVGSVLNVVACQVAAVATAGVAVVEAYSMAGTCLAAQSAFLVHPSGVAAAFPVVGHLKEASPACPYQAGVEDQVGNVEASGPDLEDQAVDP